MPPPNHNMFKDLSPNSQSVNNIIGESNHKQRSKETLGGKQRPGKDRYKPEPFFGSNYVHESCPVGRFLEPAVSSCLAGPSWPVPFITPALLTTSQPLFFHPLCFCLPLTRKFHYRTCGYLRHCCFSLLIFIV